MTILPYMAKGNFAYIIKVTNHLILKREILDFLGRSNINTGALNPEEDRRGSQRCKRSQIDLKLWKVWSAVAGFEGGGTRQRRWVPSRSCE